MRAVIERPPKFPMLIVRAQELWNQNVLAGSLKVPYESPQQVKRYSDAHETSMK
jgi:hypothetical protein